MHLRNPKTGTIHSLFNRESSYKMQFRRQRDLVHMYHSSVAMHMCSGALLDKEAQSPQQRGERGRKEGRKR